MQFLQSLPVSAQTIGLLLLSNVFMTFAWYGHLKNLATSPLYVAALASWGIVTCYTAIAAPCLAAGASSRSWARLAGAVHHVPVL